VTRAHKIANLAGIVLPLVGLLAAMALLWGSYFHPHDLVLLIVGYLLTGVGITVGYHRLFTHRAFATKKWVRYTFAILGSMAVEGPILAWVADHRKHHQFSDQHGDPHSPHLMEGEGFFAALKNLFHAHVGWLFVAEGRAEIQKYVPDLLAERGLRVIHKLFGVWLAISLIVPGLIGYFLVGNWRGALTEVLWGGAIRIFLLHHATFSINSICHF
jgi:stearoyl-CoA desaturase (delta-9 desaturase)